jgi:hypothetical protein
MARYGIIVADHLDLAAETDTIGPALIEVIQDMVAAFVQAGTNVTVNYDDTAETLTINAVIPSGGGSYPGDAYILNLVEDDLGTRPGIAAGSNIALSYNTTTNVLTISVTGLTSYPGDAYINSLISSAIAAIVSYPGDVYVKNLVEDDLGTRGIVAGAHVSLSYDTTANVLTISVTGLVTYPGDVYINSLISTAIAPIVSYPGDSYVLNTVEDDLGTRGIVAGTGITLAYNTSTNVLTISASGSGGAYPGDSYVLNLVEDDLGTRALQPGLAWPQADGLDLGYDTVANVETLTPVPSGNLSQLVTQTAHGFTVGNVVKQGYALAQANSVANAEAVGIVAAVIDANTFVLITEGLVMGLSGLTPGQAYWLSATTPGVMVPVEPSTAGQISKPMLIALTATSGLFYNYRGQLVPTQAPANPVFVFLNAAARDAYFTAPTSGLACYLTGTDEYLIYAGTAWRKPWSMPWGEIGFVNLTANLGLTTANAFTNLTGMTITATYVQGRRIAVRVTQSYQADAAGQTGSMRMAVDGTAVGGNYPFYLGASGGVGQSTFGFNGTWAGGSTAGSHVITAQACRTTGGTTLTAVSTGTLQVEDVGPFQAAAP